VKDCVFKLTVIICSQVLCAGLVVGKASASCWGNSQNVRKILPESGEKEDIVGCGMFDSLVDCWNPLAGHVWEDASLL